ALPQDVRQLRQLGRPARDLLLREDDRRQVRLREKAVIELALLAAHGKGLARPLVKAARLGKERAARVEHGGLPALLVRDGLRGELEAVEIFQLGTLSERVRAQRANREIHVT